MEKSTKSSSGSLLSVIKRRLSIKNQTEKSKFCKKCRKNFNFLTKKVK